MMRWSGTWTRYDGSDWVVIGRHDLDEISLRRPEEPRSVPMSVPIGAVGDVVKVKTHATWRDGNILVATQPADGSVGFFTDDADLAARESLHGDQHSGWQGAAPVVELTGVWEEQRVLRRSGDSAS